MAYQITDIEGVGSKFAEKLTAQGVETTDDLLERAKTPKGRKELAEVAEIRPDLVLTWANRADLMRIKGVAGQYAELMNVSGVDTVKELKHRNAANLRAKMVELNAARHICKTDPSEDMVAGWVEQAKALEPILEY